MQKEKLKGRKSMNTIAINNIWNYLNGLTLTSSEANWLSEKLKDKAGQISKAKQKAPTKEEQIREKFKDLNISPNIRKFRGSIKLDADEMKDERTKYILSK